MNDVIVCGTDFSPAAASALAWAAAIARRDGGTVDLVHVVPAYRDDPSLEGFDTAQFDAEMIARVTGRLQEAAREAARALEISVRPQLLRGHPHEELARHAREEDARMIVLGSTGAAAVERWLVGSVANRTARTADRPIVLVPGKIDQEVWSSGERRKEARPPRVVAGLGPGNDAAILRFVGALRSATPVDLTFVHLYWPVGEYERLGLHGPRPLFDPDPDVVKDLEPAVRAKVLGLRGQGAIDVEVRPAWGEPASNLLLAVEERDADLLVVGAHERHGLARLVGGTIARRLARRSRYVPIAIVPNAELPVAAPAGIPTVRTVLAVTDLSAPGNAAVAHAYSLLGPTGGVVELCHVHEHALPSPAYAYARPQQALSESDRARLLKELRDLIPAEAESRGIATHLTIVDGGKAAKAIVQASERLRADVIVMASHGRGGLARAVLGSVADAVVRQAARPVLVVRSP
jgi:nucleotide-binding universal stress UspA family protein